MDTNAVNKREMKNDSCRIMAGRFYSPGCMVCRSQLRKSARKHLRNWGLKDVHFRPVFAVPQPLNGANYHVPLHTNSHKTFPDRRNCNRYAPLCERSSQDFHFASWCSAPQLPYENLDAWQEAHCEGSRVTSLWQRWFGGNCVGRAIRLFPQETLKKKPEK